MSYAVTETYTCRAPCACSCLSDIVAERNELLAALKLAKQVADFAAYDCWLEHAERNLSVIDRAIANAEAMKP